MKTFLNKVRSLLLVPVLALSFGVFVPAATFAATTATDGCDGITSGIQGGAACAHPADGAGPSNLFGGGGIFTTIVNILLYIIGAVAVIMLIIGGIRYVTSGGDSSAVTAAKNTILYAIIGIIVALLAYAIVNFVLTSLLNSGN